MRRFLRVPTIYVLSKNKKNGKSFQPKNFHRSELSFVGIKTPSILYRRVYIMLAAVLLDENATLSMQ